MLTNKTYCLQFFSLDVFKFDLSLLKHSIFRALERDFERVYLIIVGLSLYFTSWRFNL